MKTLLSFVLAGVAAASPALAEVVDLPLPVSDSGLVTVYAAQTARINVFHGGDAARSCSFTMTLVNAAGIGLDDKTVTLVGGQADSLQFPVIVPGLVRARLDFTAQLEANADRADPMVGCYRLLPTLEVLDPAGLQQVLNTAFTGTPSVEKGKKLTRVTICHKPRKLNQTKVIPLPALKGHLGHGDEIGPCS